MGRVTKEQAMAALEMQLGSLPSLGGSYPFSVEHTRWVANTFRVLEKVFGLKSRYYATFRQLNWRFRGSTIVTADELLSQHPDEIMRGRDQEAYMSQLEMAEGLLQAALDEVASADDMESVYRGKNSGPETSAILKVISIVEHKLRKVVRTVPRDEKDVQDAFETLLLAADVPFAREKVQFEYSSRSYRPDFTLDMIDLAAEVKLCNSPTRERAIVSEINDDILGYSRRYGNLLFVVYDVGTIRDVDRFAGEFAAHENIVVRVVKH